MIDINEFDAIRIGLASTQADPRLVLGRGHEARDDQLPHAQARARRPLLRAHLRSDEGLGVLLRQVQARPLQGHHLRALRRRGDAAEGAPRAHGPHRPGRARSRTSGSSRASRAASATCSTSPRASSRRCSTSPPRSSPTVDNEARAEGPRRPRGQGQAPSPSGSTSTATSSSRRSSSGSSAAATTSRRARTKDFDEDDEFWVRGLAQLGRGAGAADARGRARARRRPLRRARAQGHDRGREEDPRARPQRPRSATTASSPPRELEHGRDRGEQIREALAPLHKELDEGDRLEEGRGHEAHQPRRSTALLAGGELDEEDAALVAGVDQKNLEKARELGNGPARATWSTQAEPARATEDDPRARERPLPAHRREDREGGPRRGRRSGC